MTVPSTVLRSLSDPRRLLGIAKLLGEHELKSLGGHWSAVRERLAVAARARSVNELVRDQIDLWPETRMRLQADHRLRKLLLRKCWKSLSRATPRG